MANSRDFTGKNRKFTGTKGIVTPKGTTGQRVGAESGELRFNTTTELMEYFDGTAWKPIDAPPTISSISTSDATGSNIVLNADGSTLFTITITGGNFGIGAVVKFIGNTGTEYAALNVNRVSGSSITCTTRSNMGTTDDPYDVQVTNASGLSALLEDAFSFNAAPVFATASGQLGTVYNGQVISGTTLNAGATDAEGNTITFSIISGSLPGSGLTLSSSTGAITGTLSGSPSLGNYPFVVQAATTEGTISRQFSIQVVALPSYSIEYLLVAGGGGGGGGANATYHGGGGGGAGGMLTGTTTVSASPNTYTITIGNGGNGGVESSPSGTSGSDGQNSTAFGSTAIGGGGGAGALIGSPGRAGGSGGGAYQGGGNTGGAGTAGQGNAGGNSGGFGGHGGDPYGAGGGGKGAAGGSNAFQTRGPGGNGATNDYSGSSVTYAGGGGGGDAENGGNWGSNGGGAAGTGGGGRGGSTNGFGFAQGENGTANRGGGGGGGQGGGTRGNGGNGGSGICIVRYTGSQVGSGGTVTSGGGYTIHTFTSGGTFTAFQ